MNAPTILILLSIFAVLVFVVRSLHRQRKRGGCCGGCSGSCGGCHCDCPHAVKEK
ncbi:MAG: FeoB-associated Cys-rich membrane protein [Bacteroidales bacterium]|nr:FeoB-associated Cys-rich membrane protein [Bacteroidales bacterium]